jgi:aminoglycoside phosphotransferase (APT) family kinase protein
MSQQTPLIDERALEDFLAKHLGAVSHMAVTRHQAGHSNETFFIDYGGRDLVLRRPPLGAFLPTAHDVGREYKVLAALASTNVRVPHVVLACSDESVIGAEFYVMERVRGEVIRDELPSAFDEKDRSLIGDELIDALVELQSVDPATCGLAGFGKPTGYLGRQLKRWRGQLGLTLPSTRPLPELEQVGDWLESNVPDSPGTSIVHGDYKLDNVVFDAGSPTRLVAILDWEMSTLGDPLADLGWMISFWQQGGRDGENEVLDRLSSVTSEPGFVTPERLVARYEELTGRDTTDLDWYVVLANWKLAVLLEGSYARHLAGATDDPFIANLESGVPALARRASRLISAQGGWK